MNGTRHDPVLEAEAIEDLRVGGERGEVTRKGSITVGARASSILDLLDTITGRWGSPHRSPLPGILWAGALLLLLAWLDHQHFGLLLIPPFAATMTIILYLPTASVAQPFAVIFGSTCGAAIGTLFTVLFGPGVATAAIAASVAFVLLPRLRAYHPPGVALALYPALLHPSPWFSILVVLPFTLSVVVSASFLSRILATWPRYPVSLRKVAD